MIKLPSWITPSTVLPLLAKQSPNEKGWAVLNVGDSANLVYQFSQERQSPCMTICFDWACSGGSLKSVLANENVLLGDQGAEEGDTLLILGFAAFLRFFSTENDRGFAWTPPSEADDYVGGSLVLASGYRRVYSIDYEQRKSSAVYECLGDLHREVLGKIPSRLSPVIEAMELLIQ